MSRRRATSLVQMPSASAVLEGELCVPEKAHGIVVFAHGSGSSRHSPRNRFVARRLEAAGLATVRVDLLTHDEEHEDARTRRLRFDVPLLSGRLAYAVRWVSETAATSHLPMGLFGVHTGVAAALFTAARFPDRIQAVVSRGGRPDLAFPVLGDVRAPTLLIVGSLDPDVLTLNEIALRRLRCEKALRIVEGAGRLFEEPGALEQVARASGEWFMRYLAPTPIAESPS